MKIRQGFVSNSSSSSFVVVLPIGFDPKSYDYTKLDEYEEYKEWEEAELSNEQIAAEMEKLIEDGVAYDYDGHIGYIGILDAALRDVGFVMPSFETGPDGGATAVVKGEKVMEFFNKEK